MNLRWPWHATDRLDRLLPGASPTALALLVPKHGVLQDPIRAEIFGAARFRQHGLSLGQAHHVNPGPHRDSGFFPRLHDNMRMLSQAHAYIGQQEQQGRAVSPAGEWLLDNFHLVQDQMREVHQHLPRRYYQHLPVLKSEHLAGLPRIYGVAWAFVAHTDSALDEALLHDFLDAYQQARELTLGELWALPTTLRVVLVENLRRLAERVAVAKAARELADVWVNQALALTIDTFRALCDCMRVRGTLEPFALQLSLRLHPDSTTHSFHAHAALAHLRQALAEVLPEPLVSQARQQAQEAADNLSLSNAIGALRLVGDIDWRLLVGRTSALMQRMQLAPGFANEHHETQDASLRLIEKLARRSGQSELAVAYTLVARMLVAADPTSVKATPGYWLQGQGLGDLRAALGCPYRRWRDDLVDRRRLIWYAYLSSLVLGSLGLTTWVMVGVLGSAAWRPGTLQASTWGLLATAGLLWWPVSEAVSAVIHRLISESVSPSRLPRLALPEGLTPAQRVVVVVPALLDSLDTLKQLSAQLERHHLSNPCACTQWALLTDFADHGAATAPGDAGLERAALAAVDALEAAYPPAAGDPRRFLWLHRPRRWSLSEQCWMGWERKRGKLAELVGWLARPGSQSPFLDRGPATVVTAQTVYVMTLDCDTVLPPGVLASLIAVAAHPLNLPRLDAAGRQLVSGYGIFQPRMVLSMPAQGEGTRYHRLFAGQCGVDSYSSASSDVYQDLFGQGSFSGKGLLHVATVHALLSDRLPPDRVLSHDLLEGALARCALVSDLSLMEDAPLYPEEAAVRLQRWTRGDWQLLPFVWQARPYGISVIDRWKMLDNLRRSLVAPMSVVLVLQCLWMGPVSPWVALFWVVAAHGAGPLLGALAGCSPARDDVALRYFYRQALAELTRVVLGSLWAVALLWHQAHGQVDALLRALYRLAVSRRHLLQWVTSAQVRQRVGHRLGPLCRAQAPLSAGALVLGAALVQAGTRHAALAVVLTMAWSASPVWMAWVSRTAAPRSPLSARERHYLAAVARDTWRYFETHVGPSSHDLPPDNVQTQPHLMVAQRTSPTNLGLYLLATACAQAFGWISVEDMLGRCERTLASMDRLTRWHGHFLNWYDTGTLAPLLPAYVSTVDSGNLCGDLVALAGACEALCIPNSPHHTRLAALAGRCRLLAHEADFSLLYDTRRHLFHIGYRLAEQQLDKSYYDLLASEARLASLWAIAKGDVPARHWLALGRPFFALGQGAGLRSWSGSMFEYLMPSLILTLPPGSALARAEQVAVQEQLAFGRALHLPWGMSESAYAVMDHSLAYQYAPQGVPRLALRRTPSHEWVVAPYASLLAAMLAPRAAVLNLRRMEALHARTDLGFVEALDYTTDRQLTGTGPTLVSTFMAHHQGMGVVALANVLLDHAPRRWAMANPHLSAVAVLLQERVPREISRLASTGPVPRERQGHVASPAREWVPGSSSLPPTHLLSNGRYSVSLRPNGAGCSRWGQVDIHRWRDDALRDAYGSFFYLRREPRSCPVSLTHHPAPDAAAHYSATFQADRVCFDAQWTDLKTRCTVWVSPEDDVELRRIEVWNLGSQALDLELMSMLEISLSEARADEAHPAFANLFVQVDWDASARALYMQRQPRLPLDRAVHAVHFLVQSDDSLQTLQVQTDRHRWLGRHRSAAHPLALYPSDSPASGALPTGLDPVASLNLLVHLPAQGRMQFTLGTAAADHRASLEALVDRYAQTSVVERSSLMSATFARIRKRERPVPASERVAVQTLTTLLSLTYSRPPSSMLLHEQSVNSQALWRLGISGDRPLVQVTLSTKPGLALVRSLLLAFRLWTWTGQSCDLVLINAEPRSYFMPLKQELQALCECLGVAASVRDAPAVCGLYLILNDDLSPAERLALAALSRVRLVADGRPLADHVSELVAWHDLALDARQSRSTSGLSTPSWHMPTPGPTGRFGDGGATFAFALLPDQSPPRPWVNVMANPHFGAQVSESGAGYTWASNCRLLQLTPWSNDPVQDPAAELFLLQDLDTREMWNLGAGQGRARQVYTVTHTQGMTTLSHHHDGLGLDIHWCVDGQAAVKQVRVVVHNQGRRTRHLRLVGLVAWHLGGQGFDRFTLNTQAARVSGRHDAGAAVQVLLATQMSAASGFGQASAFFALQAPAGGAANLHDWTCDRREWWDSRGQLAVPDHLGQQAGQGLDPGAGLSVRFTLLPDDVAHRVFLLGYGATPEAAHETARVALSHDGVAREDQVRAHWNDLLGAVTVQTPDPLFDALVNRWLLYQTLSCRLWARGGFYQAGGAFGFRDQLQDAMALTRAAPALLRAQLLHAASRQFVQGDVQHWWHVPTGAGVRTRISDDLLWLPLATAHYLSTCADATVLDESVPFLDGPALAPGEESAYFVPTVSDLSASLYEHVARAVDLRLSVGRHGLPLMGSGDWNDGMSAVGPQGQGESVWMGWFLCRVVNDCLPLAQARHDRGRVLAWTQALERWQEALRDHAWDGQWYLRAYCDDGSPLGTAQQAECQMDVLAQAWAVLSGEAPQALCRQAMASAQRHLVDDDQGLIRLLWPPLQQHVPWTGYIQAYPPGVRENGGQYAHAGVWFLMAQAALGDADGAYLSFTRLSPAHRSVDPVQGRAYGLEPYVMAGDVATADPYRGRGGWSWYTGSAAWMYRAAVETICGLQQRPGQISFTPHLPSHWREVKLSLRVGAQTWVFIFCAAHATLEQQAARHAGAAALAAGEWLVWDPQSSLPSGERPRGLWLMVVQAHPVV